MKGQTSRALRIAILVYTVYSALYGLVHVVSPDDRDVPWGAAGLADDRQPRAARIVHHARGNSQILTVDRCGESIKGIAGAVQGNGYGSRGSHRKRKTAGRQRCAARGHRAGVIGRRRRQCIHCDGVSLSDRSEIRAGRQDAGIG